MKQVEERYISLLTDKVFDRLFEEAEIAKFTPQEMREYEASKMAYRDIKNSIDTAKQEGLAEGMELGMAKGMEKGRAQGMEEGMAKGMEKGTIDEKIATAKRLLGMGVSDDQVAAITLLPLKHIEKLKNSLNIK